MIPPPHGGRLVDRVVTGPRRERRAEEIRELPAITPFIDQIYDAEKIAQGAYSPLEGFMDSATLAGVLEKGRLPDGLPWPMPIFLAPPDRASREVLGAVKPGDDIALRDEGGRPFAILHLTEKFPLEKGKVAQGAYGTQDPRHPNVADLTEMGDTALAGPVELVHALDLPAHSFERTPREMREEFQRRGWKNVAGYQCRNPPHTAHEYLQRCTLEREDVDGLLIHPVVGRLKKGDYRPEVILASYDTLVRNYYPPDRVLLASLSITMRYAGPKAALFYAIVRKNYGCGLYIVGRDQAGVGKFYDPFACQRIFDEFDVGVIPLRYGETFYCRICHGMATGKTCAHPPEAHLATSQTGIRQRLLAGESLPTEILRPEVAKILARGDALLPS